MLQVGTLERVNGLTAWFEVRFSDVASNPSATPVDRCPSLTCLGLFSPSPFESSFHASLFFESNKSKSSTTEYVRSTRTRSKQWEAMPVAPAAPRMLQAAGVNGKAWASGLRGACTLQRLGLVLGSRARTVYISIFFEIRAPGPRPRASASNARPPPGT